jgi:hypothetical protein
MRIVDEELCKIYRSFPCLVCGTRQEVCGHHIKSKGSGGHDARYNLMPLCFNHHAEIHTIGLTRFCKKYASAKWHILDNGWKYDYNLGKYLRHDE